MTKCLGFSASNIARCQREVSEPRLAEGCRTCVVHKDQEEVAKRYDGDPDDDKAIVHHHLQEMGLIPTHETDQEQVADPENQPHHLFEHPKPLSFPTELDKDLNGVVHDASKLESLRPQKFLDNEKSGVQSWMNFGEERTLSYFENDANRERISTEYGNKFQDAALKTLAGKAKDIAIVVAPIAAALGAILITIHYFILGFGVQPVAVDQSNIGTAAFLALSLSIIAYVTAKLSLDRKDKRHVADHEERFSTVQSFLSARTYIAENKAVMEEAIDYCMAGQKLGENSASIATLVSKIEREETADTYVVSPISGLLKSVLKSIPAKVLSRQPEHLLRNLKSADAVAKATWFSRKHRVEELETRKDSYLAAEANVRRLQMAQRLRDRIVSLNATLHDTDTDLKRRAGGNSWIASLALIRTIVISFAVLFSVFVARASLIYLAANYEDFCESNWRPLMNCYHLEVSLDGVSDEYKPVFYHGRVGENILISRPFEESFVSESDGFIAKLVSRTFGFSRQIIPASAVITMQTYNTRPALVSPPKDPAPPAITLLQENSFTAVNVNSPPIGLPPTGDTHVQNYDIDNVFPTSTVTQLDITNEFQNPPVPGSSQTVSLISNYILDGKTLSEPGEGQYAHIMVPFFLYPVRTQANGHGDFTAVYAADNSQGIDTVLEAFVAGFLSLSDPVYPPEAPSISYLPEDRNFLSTVRHTLQHCGSNDRTDATIEIDVVGFASQSKFKDARGKDLTNSDDLNHAVAEGRRAAVLFQVADHDANSSDKTGIVVRPRAQSKPPSAWLPTTLQLLRIVNTRDPQEITEYLRDADRQALAEAIKADVFAFSTISEMRTELNKWVPSDRGQGNAVEQAFQRSAMISISKEELQKCEG